VAADAADGAVTLERNLDLGFGLARMRNGHEMLAAILDPFDRALEPARREGAEEILRIKFAASAEAAADVVFDIVDCSLAQSHQGGEGTAVEEWQLGGTRHGEAFAIPLGEKPARLHRERGLALDPKGLAPRVRRVAKRRLDIADRGR